MAIVLHFERDLINSLYLVLNNISNLQYVSYGCGFAVDSILLAFVWNNGLS